MFMATAVVPNNNNKYIIKQSGTTQMFTDRQINQGICI
jgi:hypothetical protein